MMKKINKLFKALILLLKQPSLFNLIIESNSYWEKYLTKKYPYKKQLPVVDILEIIPNFDITLNTFSFLGGGSLVTDILLIKEICRKIPNCAYFEIGTWRGESVVNVAEVAKNCHTLNLSKEEITNLKLPKSYANLHGFFSNEKENITHLYGNSMTYNFKSLNKKFDVIFIDGNHTYEFVKNDTEKIFKHLLHENSVVIWHDYGFDPESIRNEVLAGILDGIPKKYQENLYHVSNTLCAIYSPKKLKATNIKFPIKPKKTFKVTIETNA